MYTPAHFKMKEPAQLQRFIQENSFGILVAPVEGRPFATHLPFLFEASSGEQGRLLTHLARANPHWRALDGAELLVIFAGPHAYISPSWYAESQSVPTWNYVTAHVYGIGRLLADGPELHQLLAQTVRFYEPDSPLLAHLGEEYYTQMAKGVVGLEIAINSIEGKAKLSQNRSAESIQGVIEGLRRTLDPQAHEIARLIEENQA